MSLELMLSEQQQQQLRTLIEQGLPRCPAPYDHIAKQLGITEQQVIFTLQQWKHSGLIKRFGLVVRHRKLGYVANAMVVWDVDESEVEELGELLAKEEVVTLCYQRPRRLPIWPYNLFCMIHGKERSQVQQKIESITKKHQLNYPHQLLFSTRQFKQRGARYV